MPTEYIVETTHVAGRALRVVFDWHVDRFTHTVGVVDGDHFEPLLVSVEGMADDHWPRNPAFQNLSMMESTALLVGMAGTSHYSASVEAVSSAIRFDMACRVKQQPEYLGSEYQTLPPVKTVDTGSISFISCGRSGRLQLRSNRPASVTTTSTATGITLHTSTFAESYPETIRWDYQLDLEVQPLIARL